MRRWALLMFILIAIGAAFVVDRASPTAAPGAEPLFLIFIAVFGATLVALCIAGDALPLKGSGAAAASRSK